jgi:Fur family transcriptional regulator, ferric uptake regulator
MRPSITSSRATAPRRALARLVSERRGHFTAADLLADAETRQIKIGRATVFRTLDLLAEQGALERLDLPNGEHAYVACAPQDHHHHVVCRNCGASAEVDDNGLQAVVREIGAQSGYRIEDHRLELYGLCPKCQREAEA